MSCSASSGVVVALWISNATSLAPPCFGPRSAPIAPVIAEYMSDAGAGDHARGERRGVELVLGVQDQRGVHRPHPRRRRARAGAAGAGSARRSSRRRVSTSMRWPVWLKWYQYSSIEPSAASSRSAMSRAPAASVIVLLRQRAAERRDAGAQHVHRMARGRQLLQHRPRPPRGRPRRRASFALYAASSAAFGSLPWTSR